MAVVGIMMKTQAGCSGLLGGLYYEYGYYSTRPEPYRQGEREFIYAPFFLPALRCPHPRPR